MDAAVNEAESAMESGDWAGYGEAQQRVSDALNRALEANQELGGEGLPVEPSDGGGG